MADPEPTGSVPIAWVGGIIAALAGAIALLWKASRADRESERAVAAAELERYEARERAYEVARDQAMEHNVRQTNLSERHAELLAKIADRLDRLERKADA